jgi:hypothetical protein
MRAWTEARFFLFPCPIVRYDKSVRIIKPFRFSPSPEPRAFPSRDSPFTQNCGGGSGFKGGEFHFKSSWYTFHDPLTSEFVGQTLQCAKSVIINQYLLSRLPAASIDDPREHMLVTNYKHKHELHSAFDRVNTPDRKRATAWRIVCNLGEMFEVASNSRPAENFPSSWHPKQIVVQGTYYDSLSRRPFKMQGETTYIFSRRR